jgi:hypothetical protein
MFGFEDVRDFSASFIHINLTPFLILLAWACGIIELMFGLKILTLCAFIILLIVELVSGIWASKVKGIKITSHRFNRFIAKLFLWLVCFFIINSLKREQECGTVLFYLYSWLYQTVMTFVIFEYLLSVIENIGAITGKSNFALINTIIRKLSEVCGLKIVPPKEEKKEDLDV